MAKPKIIVVLGPTASGKTELGVFLAKKFNGEVINADSRQIYKEMDIATGKPDVKSQKSKVKSVRGVPHHLFDIAKPDQVITVAKWKEKAIVAANDILKRGKLPIIVGGTGLYVKSLVDNLDIPEVPPNKKLRAKLEKEIKSRGLDFVYRQLLRMDPEAINVVQKENPRRVIRAIEVCLATHKPFTSLRVKGKPLFKVLELGINISRDELYKRIDDRVDGQIKSGLVKETKKLIKKYKKTLPSMSGIGYGEIIRYVKSEISFAEAIQLIKFHTHDYARRQMAWFRADKKIKWIKDKNKVVQVVKKFLN